MYTFTRSIYCSVQTSHIYRLYSIDEYIFVGVVYCVHSLYCDLVTSVYHSAVSLISILFHYFSDFEFKDYKTGTFVTLEGHAYC